MKRADYGTIEVTRLLRLTAELDSKARDAADAEGINLTEWWRRAGLLALRRRARQQRKAS